MKKLEKILSKIVVLAFLMGGHLGLQAQTCEYTTSSVTFNIGTPGSYTPPATRPNATVKTVYLLVDNATQQIVQISTTTPTFSNIVQSKLYDVVAFTYEDDGSVTGLTVGGQLSAVNSACNDKSNALTVRICPTSIPSTCDYTTSSFTVRTTTTPITGATTQYLLADLNGVILQISSTPTFSGLTGSKSYNVYAVTNTGTLSGLTVGNNISAITSSECVDLSNPLPITVCVCQPTCLPVTVTKVK